MGSTKWGTRNRPTRDWEQPAKKTGNMYSQREMGNSSLMENWEQPSSNWVQPTPRDNRQELWRPNPSAFIYGYQIEHNGKAHHAGLPAPGTTETASTRHNNNKSNVTQKTANGQQGANGEQTNKRLGTTSQKLGIANRKQGTASQHNQVPTGNWWNVHSHAEQRHQCRECRDCRNSAQPTIKEQIKCATGNSQQAMGTQTNKRLAIKLGTANGMPGTTNGKLGTATANWVQRKTGSYGETGNIQQPTGRTDNGKLGSTASSN
ncbi:hypothetical protein B0H13DRAFT_1864110 [Mycena leptocephala]|nr:hypothetical protein B0H13DRAFT_1864110 [Mycena leptocephala]